MFWILQMLWKIKDLQPILPTDRDKICKNHCCTLAFLVNGATPDVYTQGTLTRFHHEPLEKS